MTTLTGAYTWMNASGGGSDSIVRQFACYTESEKHTYNTTHIRESSSHHQVLKWIWHEVTRIRIAIAVGDKEKETEKLRRLPVV